MTTDASAHALTCAAPRTSADPHPSRSAQLQESVTTLGQGVDALYLRSLTGLAGSLAGRALSWARSDEDHRVLDCPGDAGGVSRSRGARLLSLPSRDAQKRRVRGAAAARARPADRAAAGVPSSAGRVAFLREGVAAVNPDLAPGAPAAKSGH